MGISEYLPVKQNEQDDYANEGEATTTVTRCQSCRKAARITAISFLVALLALMMLVGVASLRHVDWRGGYPGTFLLQETFFPKFVETTVTFKNGGDFTRNDEHGDQLWDELVPVGAGYIRVPNPRQYDLPPSEIIANDTENAEMYQVSVVHQLHCLALFRWHIRSLEQGTKPAPKSHMHITHCIEYIRQAIMCTADTTLEQGDVGGSFSAEGAIHRCRDWSAVESALVEHRVGDERPPILGT